MMKCTNSRLAWSKNEDRILVEYVQAHGAGKWASLPMKAGLKRSGKSCRLRWMNYLRPNIKRGAISNDEEQLIIRLHSLLGNRWSLIAGRLPGRTDNEIKNYWNNYLKKKLSVSKALEKRTESPKSDGGNGNESKVDTEKGIETFCDYNDDDDGVGSKQFAFSGLKFAANEKVFKVFEERVANCVCMNPTEGYKEDIEIDESVWYCSIEDYHFHSETSWENALLPLW